MFTVKNKIKLSDFLSKKLKLSKTKVKKLLDKRQVFVNNKRIWIAGYQLKLGDKVEVSGDVKNKEESSVFPSLLRLEILYEDEQYLIFNKPAGINANGKNSFEELVRKKFGKNELIAVHRLDKDTSGCLIFARNNEIFQKTKDIFRRKEINKKYLAWVKGKVIKKDFIIKKSIEGKEAITSVKTLKSDNKASLLELEIPTGRKHQIRIHLADIGHPVIGDKEYFKGNISDNFKFFPSQLLHAKEVELVNPFTNKKIKALAKEPREFSFVI